LKKICAAMKKVKVDTLTLYLNELVTVFTGFQNQLPEDKNVIEGTTAITRLNIFTYRQENGKVTTSSTIFSQSS